MITMNYDIRKDSETIISLGRLFFISEQAIKENDEMVQKLLEELYVYVNNN